MKDDDLKRPEEQADENAGTGDTEKLPKIGDAVPEENGKEGKKPLVLFGREFARKKVYGVCAGVLCAALIAGGGIAIANTNGANARNENQAEATQTQAKSEEKEQMVLTLNVKAEGWDKETSTLVIAHIVSEDGKVDFYHAFNANERVEIPVGAGGIYNVTFVSIVNADGSIYKADGSKTATAGKAGSGSAGTNVDFKKVEAGDVTKDDLTAIAKDVAEAVKKGDYTLTGNSGVQVAKKYEDNIKSNANADAEEVAKETEAAQETAKEEKSEAKNPDASSSNSGGSNSGSGNAKQDSTPVHQHNYNIPITKTVHHDAVYSTVHHDAQYTTVHHDAVTHTEVQHICNGCGANITGSESSHAYNALMSGNTKCGAYHDNYVTVTDSSAWDERVLVSNAWDEQVLVSNAWDETVTTGYKCSCGATK